MGLFINFICSWRDGEDFATDLREKLATEFDEVSLWQDRKQMKGGVGWWQHMRSQADSTPIVVTDLGFWAIMMLTEQMHVNATKCDWLVLI